MATENDTVLIHGQTDAALLSGNRILKLDHFSNPNIRSAEN